MLILGATIRTSYTKIEPLRNWKAWHVPNADVTTTRQSINMIFEELEQPARMGEVHQLMTQLAGFFMPGAREAVEMMYEFEKDFVADRSLFTTIFGLQATPYHDGIKQAVAWCRAGLMAA